MHSLELQDGFRATASADWREHAINAALYASAVDGASADALLREIRLQQPGASTLILWVDRQRLLQFLDEEMEGAEQLLSGSVSGDATGEFFPYVGWYRGRWEGELVEIALSPTGNAGGAVCIADEEAVVRRFGRALRTFAEQPGGRCLLFSGTWRSAPELDAQVGAVTWDDIVLPAELLAAVREAVEGFFRHRQAFATLGFPWRRGILLVGPPGTGKTMICKAAVAAAPELPFLYVRDLRQRGPNDVIRTVFERARNLAPCILAFEDIDGFVDESNRTVFLNEMDGFQNNEGLLIIGSSNHPGQIDEALLKRPSRFDRVFHIGLPGPAERRDFCQRAVQGSRLAERLSPALDLDRLADQVAERTDGFTPAYLKEALIGAALERAQEGATGLDQEFADAVLRQVEQLALHLRRLRNPAALAELNGEEPALGFRSR